MFTRFASDGSTSDRSSNVVTESDQLRGFFNTRRAITSGDYLLRKWLPILGPELFTLIKVLCSMGYFNPETGELRQTRWPTNDTLVTKLGISCQLRTTLQAPARDTSTPDLSIFSFRDDASFCTCEVVRMVVSTQASSGSEAGV